MVYHVQFPGLGWEFTIDRVALSVGGFNIYWYGVIIAVGMLLALLYAFRHAVDFGIDADRLVDVVAIGTVMAIVCARIYYVAMAPFQYQSFWEMVDIRLGGIAIYGAVIGAFVFGGLAAKWRKVPLLPLFDLVALGFLIGQGVGRWGNFVNQEAFGTNTTLPWGMYSEGTEAYLRSVQVTLPAGVTIDPTLPVHPTFFYESLWCLIGFVVLALYVKRRRFHGQIFLLYVIWYGLGRSWIEGLRTDSLLITGTDLRASQVVAFATAFAAFLLLVAGLRRTRGQVLRVPLAVRDIRKQARAGDRFSVDTLPANAPHAEFVAATEAMNRRLDSLDLDAPEIEELEDPEPAMTQEPQEAEEPEEPEQETVTAAEEPAAEEAAEAEDGSKTEA
ncbi:MAG TPA: prolipoprotein diacylglyceryl transferase [Candidatus Gemmiger excrementavium]|uniref:Phosphatidylglycerol--prolipoprotein diacylglyceryl transferase n=1 Tax=Candidatus Gemmiger excrementavium TaxID=2838608 RepID=A0A9D2F2G1_9FIRM|nr:prolipoprotein diacylglyceryl transferase [Candidatus Gemmiger excrementavium]